MQGLLAGAGEMQYIGALTCLAAEVLAKEIGDIGLVGDRSILMMADLIVPM